VAAPISLIAFLHSFEPSIYLSINRGIDRPLVLLEPAGQPPDPRNRLVAIKHSRSLALPRTPMGVVEWFVALPRWYALTRALAHVPTIARQTSTTSLLLRALMNESMD